MAFVLKTLSREKTDLDVSREQPRAEGLSGRSVDAGETQRNSTINQRGFSRGANARCSKLWLMIDGPVGVDTHKRMN